VPVLIRSASVVIEMVRVRRSASPSMAASPRDALPSADPGYRAERACQGPDPVSLRYFAERQSSFSGGPFSHLGSGL
jgi:hypothetical protein